MSNVTFSDFSESQATQYISKVAKTEKEVCSLTEAGFEFFTEFEGARIFRKHKS